MSRSRSRFVVGLTALALAAGCSRSLRAPDVVATGAVARGCPPERAQDGEVRLVFLGDSGYGQGFAEWGLHGQEAIASRLNNLRLAPDLVLFLGDNVYWLGSNSLYKARFDDMYDPLIRGCKVHVGLGNHDVKGCRVVEEQEKWQQSCLQELRSALLADRKARYMRQGLAEPAATAKAEADAATASAGELAAQALATDKANCLPGDATAYQDVLSGANTCNATAALTHAQFGFGSIQRGTASQRQRYYSILWPLPKLAGAGAPDPAAVTQRPLVDLIALDSNTLRVGGGMLE
jgi:calcineurin-like phosphoesterase family protein